MGFLCIGLSHKSAPLSVREKLALTSAQQVELLQELNSFGEAMVVSTCNRVEFYLAGKSSAEIRAQLLQVIRKVGGHESTDHLYEHLEDGGLVHLFRVSASLDSMVVGEPQILGQVKDAFELAQKAGTVRGELARACAAAFSSAKRVRSETGIGRAAISMASAAVDMAIKIFGALDDKTVLVVGAGEMAEVAARHLRSAGASKILVTNRTLEKAQTLAEMVNGEARPFEGLLSHLVAADVVVCSTASPVPIFTRENVAGTLKLRKHRPLFMVDLAVPRDIAPDVNELDNVYSYDVDDIQRVIDENSAARQVEAHKAEQIIAEEIARFVRARALRDGLPVLAQLRSRAEQVARAEAEKTLAFLGDELTEKQKKSVMAMGMAIMNKFLHQPTAKLRQVHADGSNHLAEAAAELFGLDGGGEGAEARRDTPEPRPVPVAVNGVKP